MNCNRWVILQEEEFTATRGDSFISHRHEDGWVVGAGNVPVYVWVVVVTESIEGIIQGGDRKEP